MSPEQLGRYVGEFAGPAARQSWKNQSMRKAKKPLKVVAGAEDRPLTIGDIEIQCYVLEDETRVLSQAGMFRGLSLAKRGGSVAIDGGAQVPRFAASKALNTPYFQ